MTHDYKRHGTTTLFAALNVLTGEVTAQNMARHRHQELLRFLNRIKRCVPADKAIHVILDNSCTHKHANLRARLARHPRWTFHFIPTSSSWLNAVEGFFAKLTRRRLKHGVFRSVNDLKTAITRFIEQHNTIEARPFTWRADPDKIIAARNRGFQLLDSIHQRKGEPCARRPQTPNHPAPTPDLIPSFTSALAAAACSPNPSPSRIRHLYKTHRFGPAGDAQFHKDAVDVILDRGQFQAQVPGNLFVRHPLLQKAQYEMFLLRQATENGGLGLDTGQRGQPFLQAAGNPRRAQQLACCGGLDRLDQLVYGMLAGDAACRPGLERGQHVLFRVAQAQDHHRSSPRPVKGRSDHIPAPGLPGADRGIHDNDVGGRPIQIPDQCVKTIRRADLAKPVA